MARMAAASLKQVDAAWRPGYPMSRLSSWRAGGKAAWLFTPQGVQRNGDNPMLTLPYALPPQVSAAAGQQTPLFVGYGSNLLVRDGGYDGIVVHTASGLAQLTYDDGVVYAGSGVGCPKLARFCSKHGRDAAFFAGIPGTVGGALAMNAGCYGRETRQYVASVTIIYGGAVRQLSPRDFTVGYRSVAYPPADEVYFVAAHFRFPEGETAALNGEIKSLLQQRSQTQPLGNACAGSVFRNPPGDYAGRLIEQCGLKGLRIGGAVVSDKHANFILNDQKASAADIEELMLQVQTRVYEQTGVLLQPEVKIVGKAV